MSRWQTNFENNQGLQRIQAALNSLSQAKTNGYDSTAKEEYNRAIKVLKIIEQRFLTLDPELFGINSWQNLGHNLNQIQGIANAAASNSHNLNGLNNTLDEVLNILRPIDIKFSEADVKAMSEALAFFRQKADQEIESLKQQVHEVKNTGSKFSAEVDQVKVRLEKLDKTIDDQKKRLDDSIAEFQKQFSGDQATRNAEFLKAVTDMASRFKSEFDVEKREWDKILEGLKTRSNDDIKHISDIKKKVDDLYGAIGSAAISGNFNVTANEERHAADAWRMVAFGLMVIMVGGAIATFALTIANPTQWEAILIRFGTVCLFSIPAFYAANESSKHRNREKTIRKNFLELSAIDAYLVHLPPDKQNEIKGKLSEKFFGVPEPVQKGDPASTKHWLAFIEKLVKDLTSGH